MELFSTVYFRVPKYFLSLLCTLYLLMVFLMPYRWLHYMIAAQNLVMLTASLRATIKSSTVQVLAPAGKTACYDGQSGVRYSPTVARGTENTIRQ